MYSHHRVAIDKGLGFDFSGIADMVKAALPVTLNLYNNQMQLKQIKQMQANGYAGGYIQQSPGVYGQSFSGQLPLTSYLQPQPTFGGQYMQPDSGIGTGTMLAIAGAAVMGILAYKLMR